MTPELAKWLVGAIASSVVVLVGAIVWVSVLAFRVGKKIGDYENTTRRLDEALLKLDHAADRIGRIDVLESRLEQFANAHGEMQRRFASDFPEMREKVATLWEKVFSLSNWRKSSPNFDR